MNRITYLCDGCFHPVIDGYACPFCGTERITEKCEVCRSPKLALPSTLEFGGVQYICQECAFHTPTKEEIPWHTKESSHEMKDKRRPFDV